MSGESLGALGGLSAYRAVGTPPDGALLVGMPDLADRTGTRSGTRVRAWSSSRLTGSGRSGGGSNTCWSIATSIRAARTVLSILAFFFKLLP